MSRIDQPVVGYYTVRLIRRGLRVAVRIFEDGGGLRVMVDGRTERADGTPLDVHEVWPYCAGHRITEREYEFLRARADWASEPAPDHPAANPREPIDLRSLKPGW